ncbi:bifunctional ribokinase/ribose-5-phosphate isomerase A [Clostridiales bacterium]|nr:bifunctional ribokinase/ribose-5-phosphate isomerase A [Clostridiales bacterium]
MKILNFGSLNIDYVYKVDSFLLPGETKSSISMDIHCGGKGLNQSIAAAKAGNEVYHAAYLGNDGQMLKSIMEENGVNVDMVKNHDSTSGHAIIQVDKNGQNCILLYGGTNQLLTEDFIDEVLDNFGNTGLVLLQNETNLVGYIIEKAAEKGLQVALNAAPMNEKVLGYPLEKLTWLIVNEVEGKQIAGCEKDEEIINVLREKYPKCKILLTLGSNGACCYADKVLHKIGCHKVNVVDTTAAGDTFTGYFLYGILNGSSIGNALQIATIASSICVQRNGAANSVPLKAEIDEILGSFEKLEVTTE